MDVFTVTFGVPFSEFPQVFFTPTERGDDRESTSSGSQVCLFYEVDGYKGPNKIEGGVVIIKRRKIVDHTLRKGVPLWVKTVRSRN